MAARTLVLVASLALIALLAFLSVSVAVRQGINIRVVISVVILAILGFGVIGALTESRGRDD